MPHTTNKQLTSLQSLIIAKKNYVMALHRRIAMVGIGSATKTDYEKNEVEITTHETLDKIWHTEKQIKHLELNHEVLLEAFLQDLAEVNDHYDAFLDLAKTNQKQDITLKHLLHSANWKLITENADEKIHFYKLLKEALSTYLNKEK